MLKNLDKFKVVLASRSPRRQMLLDGLGVDFETIVLETDESYSNILKREAIAEYLSKKKADEFAAQYNMKGLLVITADTIVMMDNKVLNKPVNKDDAVAMLNALSGRMHEVVTGVTIKTEDKEITFHAISKVFFKVLNSEEIDYYIESFKPFDKAGSYGIQEWIGYIGIENIEGSYFNVMGLPTQRLYEYLKEF
ncbi:MAG: Maf family nucleotide pyrophosphatase [Bacteroidota bacterium]